MAITNKITFHCLCLLVNIIMSLSFTLVVGEGNAIRCRYLYCNSNKIISYNLHYYKYRQVSKISLYLCDYGTFSIGSKIIIELLLPRSRTI